MAINIANFQTVFKTLFPEKDLPWLIPANLPFLNMIEKDGSLSGDLIDQPFKYGAAQGYSTDFNTAASQAGNPNRAVRAGIRCAQAYKFCEFDDKSKGLSEGEGAYVEIVQDTIGGAIMDFNKNFDLDLHAAANGYRGVVAAVAGQTNPFNPTQTLVAGQVVIAAGFGLEAVFDQDQSIVAATFTGFTQGVAPSDGRLPTSTSVPVQILQVDPLNRVLNLSDASAFIVGAFVCQAGGTLGFNSANLNGGFCGLDAWNPYGGVTSSDNFWNINRSVYGTRLAGYWMDGSRLSIEDGIKRLSARMSQGGAQTSNIALINPLDFDALDSKMMGPVRYGSVTTATHGFDSIVINGAAGRIDIVADPHMAQGFVRLIDPSTFILRHRYEMPHIVDVEGRTMEQGVNIDGRTCRLRAYAQLICRQPQKNGIVKLPYIGI